MEETLKTFAVIVSCISAIISLLAAYRSRIAAKQARELQILGLLRQYYADLRSWADDVVDVLSEAAYLCELDTGGMSDGEFFRTRHNLRGKLSALVDRGRWFLPNESPEAYGGHKSAAFRGFRHAALDGLVEAVHVLEGLNDQQKGPNAPQRDVLIEIKREFVSRIQDSLDPRSWRSEIANLRADAMKAA